MYVRRARGYGTHTEEDYLRCSNKVKPRVAGFHRNQHNVDLRVISKLQNRIISLGARHATIVASILPPLAKYRNLEEVQHGSPLAEDDGLLCTVILDGVL